MEYALWQSRKANLASIFKSLNPCSNGICSLTIQYGACRYLASLGLNPCSNGICSLTNLEVTHKEDTLTGLNPCSNGICSLTELYSNYWIVIQIVLILVLMEYALWLPKMSSKKQLKICLNPCSNGICSLTV